jgi:sensor histidine kinase YesM
MGLLTPLINKRTKTQIVFAVLAFWLAIGLMIFITEYIASHFFGAKPLDEIEKKQYMVRYVIWPVLTPLIIYFALKFRFSKTRILAFSLIHLALGTLFLLCEFTIEVAIIKPIATEFYKKEVLVDEFTIPYLYKFWGYIAIYFLIIGVVNIFMYINRLQTVENGLTQAELKNSDLQYQLTLSQLQALKMQIHPHFLFNTHNSVIGLIIKKENEKAAKMLTKLSELLRNTLEKQDTEFITLAEELKAIDLYMEIQTIRFPERFVFNKKVSAEAENILVPYFILQPLVENAVIHGIEKIEENGVIGIHAAVEKDFLKISISDNGTPGKELSKLKMGVGLSNVSQRLRQYYAENASLELAKDVQGNSVVTLMIPVK